MSYIWPLIASLNWLENVSSNILETVSVTYDYRFKCKTRAKKKEERKNKSQKDLSNLNVISYWTSKSYFHFIRAIKCRFILLWAETREKLPIIRLLAKKERICAKKEFSHQNSAFVHLPASVWCGFSGERKNARSFNFINKLIIIILALE